MIKNVAGKFISEGVDCDSKLPPLCLSFNADISNSDIDQLCEECSSSSENFSCKKWVNLEDVMSNQGISVTGVELCLDTCLPSVENDYSAPGCLKNIHCKVFIFVKFDFLDTNLKPFKIALSL